MAKQMTRPLRNQFAYLGAVMLAPEKARDSVTRLMPSMFAEGGPAEIFTACFQLMYAGKAVDPVTVIGMAGEQYKTMAVQMAETCPAVSHLAEYEALVVEDYRKAQLTATLGTLATGDETADAVCAQLRGLLDKQDAIRNMQLDGSAREFDAVLDETVRELGKPDKSYKFGWRAIDRYGLMEPENSIVIAGRPGCGKTDFAINLAARLSKKYKVYYLTLEETDKKLMQRMLSKMTQIDSGRMRDRRLTDAEYMTVNAVADALKRHHNMILDSDSNVTVEGIRAKLLRHKPQIAFVDHIGLIAGTDPRQTEYQRLSDATRQLKLLAMQMGIVIVELSQLSRNAARDGGRFGSLADLRGSGTIEQDANAVLFVQNLPANAERLSGADAWRDSGVFVAKNREGALGVIDMIWQPQYHSWRPHSDGEGGAAEAEEFIQRPAGNETPVQMKMG